MKKKTNSKKKERIKEEKLEREVKEAEKEIVAEKAEKEIFFEEPIRQIPISAEIKTPVLERIIQRQDNIEIPIQAQQERKTSERKIDYSPALNEPNYGFTRNAEENIEKKYETNFTPPILTRKEMLQNEGSQDFFTKPAENWNNRNNEPQLHQIEFIEQEINLPFEEEKKYKKTKLR